MDLLRPVIASLVTTLASYAAGVGAGTLADRAGLTFRTGLWVVIGVIVVALVAGGALTALAHRAPHRYRLGRHLLAVAAVPALLGLWSALNVHPATDGVVLARLGNLLVPPAAVIGGALLVRRWRTT